jgi:hypothetical protein
MSNLFPHILPPVSSATYLWLFMTTTEPSGNTLGSTATVRPTWGILPHLVGFPVAQYAVAIMVIVWYRGQ